jgi:hypothetical protein
MASHIMDVLNFGNQNYLGVEMKINIFNKTKHVEYPYSNGW